MTLYRPNSTSHVEERVAGQNLVVCAAWSYRRLVFGFLGLPNKVPQIGWLKQQKCIVS